MFVAAALLVHALMKNEESKATASDENKWEIDGHLTFANAQSSKSRKERKMKR